VCEVLGADGLVYQDVDDLIATGRELNPSITEVRGRHS
jgi:amidophosphoribosyltransferase